MTNDRKLSRRTALLLPFALAGCSTIEGMLTPASKRLPGVRESVLPVRNGLDIDAAPGTAISLPPPHQVAEWLQPGGDPTHALGDIDGPTKLAKLWQNDIGTGTAYRRKLVVQPVVQGGRVFTMDVDGLVSAFRAKDGTFLWQFDPAPEQTDSTNVGGGLSTDGTYLFITTGYGDLIALHPETAKVAWRVQLGGPARSAATVSDGVLYLITLDARLIAYQASNGAILWTYQGQSAATLALATSEPAVWGDYVTAAFGSGEIACVERQTGTENWTDTLSTARTLVSTADIATVTSPTVISDGKVFAIGLDGTMLAIDVKSGRRVWERDVGGFEMPCVVGGVVFVYGDGHLLALTRDEGTALWITEVPGYRNMKKRSGAIVWHGPLMVGSKIWMAGDNGQLLALDPANGAMQAPIRLGEKIALAPIVAGGRWYVEFESGAIAAYG